MSTSYLILTGVAAGAVIVFVGLLIRSTEEHRPLFYRPAHRSQPVPWKPDLEAPLPPSRGVTNWEAGGSPRYLVLAELEEQIVSWPVGHPEQARPVVVEERTEEVPVVAGPVVHRGADEGWSPTQELKTVPERPIDALAALEQDIEDEVRREVAMIFGPIEYALARLGHSEQDTCEWNFAELRREIEAAQPGGAR